MTSKIKQRKITPPFQFDYCYPSQLKQITTKIYNFIFDSLYPIKPLVFSAAFASLSSYFYTHQSILPAPFNFPLGFITLSFIVSIIPVILLRAFLRFFIFRYKGHLFESGKKMSRKSKFWAVCYFLLQKYAPPRLYSCNSLLPKQPVPTLHKTLLKFMEGMEFVTTQQDFVRIQSLIPKFLSVDGPKLQQKAKLNAWLSKNYVSNFWERFAYLRRREPLLINSSVCSVDFLAIPPQCTQASRAAHIAYLTTLQMLSFGDQSQSPPANGLMYSGYYKRLFANSRIPGITEDHWDPRGYSKHVIVWSKGCFYRLEMFDAKTNKIYSPEQLTDVLTEVLERDDIPTDSERKVASLAHDWRDKWAENRQNFFLSNPTNAKFLEQIESSIFFLVLDEADDYGFEGDNTRLSNFTRSILTGNGMNRWPDKPMNIICSKNGRAGACSEHSFADGPEYVHFMESLFGSDTHFLSYPNRQTERLTHYNPITNLRLAERLEIEMVDGMDSEIQRCYNEYSKSANDVDVASMIFKEWGKGKIKSTNCSPDAFFQMAIQLAYFKENGKFMPTYEAAANRFYDYSRTETIRSVTRQSCEFAKSMLNSKKNKTERANLLIAACKKHHLNSRLAMTGKGIDRHLFALYIISKGMGVESEFLDDYIKREWTLSTTQTPYLTNIMDEDNGSDQERWMGGSFGAVVKDGYGIAYHFMGNNSISFHVSSYHSSPRTSSFRFQSLLVESLQEMMQLF